MSAENRVSYPVNDSQSAVIFQITYSPNKRLMQIPMYISINDALDIDLLKKAAEIEYERNDALHLRFFKEDDKYFQYFEENVTPDVRTMDFTGKTKEYQDAELEKDAMLVQDWLNGDLCKFIVFKSYNGGTGIYVHVSHLMVDASAIVILLNDIFNVYFALRDGTEMPKPLDKFEECIKRNLNIDEARVAKATASYDKMYREFGEPTYAGICGSGPLKLQRILFRNKKQQYIVPTYALSEKIGTDPYHVSAAESKKFFDFCENNHVNMLPLLQLAIRSYCSSVNGRQKNIIFNTVCSNRSLRSERNTCGSLGNSYLLYTHIEEDTTATEALEYLSTLNMTGMRNMCFPTLPAIGMLYKMYNTQKHGAYTSFLLTYIPIKLNLPENWKLEYKWYDPGNAFPNYIFIFPDLNGDGLMFNYEYRKVHIKKKQVAKLHSYVVKFMNAVADNPNITMKELLDIKG